MNNFGKNLAITILVVVVFLLMLQHYGESRKYKNALEEIFALNQDKKELFKTIDDQGREITGTRNTVLYNTKQIESQLKEIAELKTLEQKIVFSTETRFETLSVPVHDTLIVVKGDTINAKRFTYNDTWLSIDAKIVADTVTFDSLSVFNKYDVEFGESKTGLFKKKEKMVYIRNENPYSTTKEVMSFKLEETPKWYQRGVWKFIGGGAAAFLLFRI